MANIVSYNDIIELMRSIAERHYQINTFFLGKDWELENNQDIQYPILQVFPQFASMPINNWKEYKTLELTLNCKVVDLTTPAEENEMDVHSDTLRISQDIVNELNQHPYYIRSNVSLMETINFEAIEEFKDDISAGWKFQLKLRIINANTFCGMPIAELDGISANGPTSSGQYVNVRYLTCETLPDCPVIIDIQEAIAGLTGATAAPSDLSSVLGVGNSTGNQIITAGTNTSNILQVSDTVMGMSWNDAIGGNITLDDSGTYVYSDANVYIESQSTVDITGTNVDITGNGFHVDVTDNAHITTDNSLYLAKIEEVVKPTRGYVLTYTLNQTSGLYTSINVMTSVTNNTVEISSNNPNFVGAVYNADYSSNFINESLVTKRYVDNLTPSTPSLQDVITVNGTINGLLSQSPDTSTYIYMGDGYIDMSSYDGSATSGFNMYASTGNNLYSDTSNSITSPKITLTASGTASMTMNQYNTTFTGNVTVTSNNDNAGISIVSPPGFYYPSLVFYNVGNNFLGAITGYAGQLYIGGVSGTPLIVNSAAINLPLETVNSLLYVDSGSNVKSAHLGVGLSFSGGTLSNTLDLSGYVPYTGATTNLDMGIYGLSASSLNIQGTSTLNGAINTAMSGSSNRLVESSSTGALTATRELIDGFLVAGTAATLLTTTASWTGVNYTGTAITGTYQGQQYYNNTYVYLAVNDNDWVRMARV